MPAGQASVPGDLMQYGVDDVRKRPALGRVVAFGSGSPQARLQGLQNGLHVGRQQDIMGVQAHGGLAHPLQPGASLLLSGTTQE